MVLNDEKKYSPPCSKLSVPSWIGPSLSLVITSGSSPVSIASPRSTPTRMLNRKLPKTDIKETDKDEFEKVITLMQSRNRQGANHRDE
ncbi:hypothetical protein L195_g028424 [Trifolium pratense]|uniref:Uncharacterized protein n=1 Tax=Trifolium pratense TaxID=57577 RepID=A0A2K3L1Y2_TRIPR|nr:hypothetical protein L195_g028424 [Trifolium pratense]